MGGDAPMERQDSYPEPSGTTQGVGFARCGLQYGPV